MLRSSPVYREMSFARARFKYALRQYRLDELTISSTKLADSMDNHDVDSFWKDIKERNKSKSTMSDCIEGITGEADIAKTWRDHYGSLINSSLNTTSKESVCDNLKNILFSDGMLVSVNKVLTLVDNLESNKSAGMDGLNGECMKNTDVILSVLLSFCFTYMLKHSYLLSAMLDSVIIPLVKNKSGDLSDKNNYRPIVISCIDVC